jgi:hypothetical protein
LCSSLALVEANAGDDWVEVANFGPTSVALEGWSVRSKKQRAELSGKIEPGARIVAALAISKRKDRIELSGPSGLVDTLELPRQPNGASYGRDARGRLGFFVIPTPGAPPDTDAMTAIAPPPKVRPTVLRQDGSRLPQQWGTGPSSTTADYAMQHEVGCRLESLPTISIAVDPAELFDRARGIYAYPGQRWERRANVEMLPFGRDPGFSLQAGLRIQGGSSTQKWKSKKLSLRLRFAEEFGGRLDHRLFSGKGGHRFANLILDAQLNLTWVHPDREQRAAAQYVRDAFVADLMLQLGSPAPRGRFVHLHLAGLYWGVYFLHERPDAHFAAARFGGKRKDWEVVRDGPEWVGGKGARWNEMMQLARSGLADAERYRFFAERHLDVPAFIDYVIVNLWSGNEDWPANNWYAAASSDQRWRFFVWDSERVLTDASVDRTAVRDPDSPGELLGLLLESSEFRAQLRRRANALLRRELAPGRALAVYSKRIEELRPAIACEAGRWGDTRGPSYGLRDWTRELDRLRRAWFPKRNEIFRRQIASLTDR